MSDAKQKGGRPKSTRARIREEEAESGGKRSAEVKARVRATLKVIRQEMAANGGIYPHNKGALSKAEVARRAGIHPTTFHTENQRRLGERVGMWLEALKASKVVGRGRVRRELGDRIADWKALHEGLLQSHRDTELELMSVKGELTKAHLELERLRSENKYLQKELVNAGDKKVVPFTSKKV